jgi:hypothetical protein
MVLSSCQSFPGTGAVSTGAPGLGLNVPGKFHFGYSKSSRAHSFLLTSNISTMSTSAERIVYPIGVLGLGVIYESK